MEVGGRRLPLVIAGDAAYPLQTWLVKAYPATQQIEPSKALFNTRLGCARVVVEHAYTKRYRYEKQGVVWLVMRLDAEWANRRIAKFVTMQVHYDYCACKTASHIAVSISIHSVEMGYPVQLLIANILPIGREERVLKGVLRRYSKRPMLG